MESPNLSQFLRSATDHGTRVSICKKCLATVADTASDTEMESKERDHLCKASGSPAQSSESAA